MYQNNFWSPHVSSGGGGGGGGGGGTWTFGLSEEEVLALIDEHVTKPFVVGLGIPSEGSTIRPSPDDPTRAYAADYWWNSNEQLDSELVNNLMNGGFLQSLQDTCVNIARVYTNNTVDGIQTVPNATKLGGVLASDYVTVNRVIPSIINPGHAETADRADQATLAFDSDKLGGVSASNYVTKTFKIANAVAADTAADATKFAGLTQAQWQSYIVSYAATWTRTTYDGSDINLRVTGSMLNSTLLFAHQVPAPYPADPMSGSAMILSYTLFQSKDLSQRYDLCIVNPHTTRTLYVGEDQNYDTYLDMVTVTPYTLSNTYKYYQIGPQHMAWMHFLGQTGSVQRWSLNVLGTPSMANYVTQTQIVPSPYTTGNALLADNAYNATYLGGILSSDYVTKSLVTPSPTYAGHANVADSAMISANADALGGVPSNQYALTRGLYPVPDSEIQATGIVSRLSHINNLVILREASGYTLDNYRIVTFNMGTLSASTQWQVHNPLTQSILIDIFPIIDRINSVFGTGTVHILPRGTVSIMWVSTDSFGVQTFVVTGDIST